MDGLGGCTEQGKLAMDFFQTNGLSPPHQDPGRCLVVLSHQAATGIILIYTQPVSGRY
ncbi:hypothetical protein KJ839_05715 [Patescibacteria group bacterium]|nr:hypothetical protein [Patescibacteria group bacterium]MBU1963908.1 hypothetical protein [Patescibacteria group bacterium]